MLLADRPTTSRWTPHRANAPIRSGRSSKARTEADTSSARHPRRSQSHSESDLGSPSTLREPSPTPGNQIQHRDRIRVGRPSEAPSSALAQCHGLSCLDAAGGRLLQPGDAEAEPLEADGARRATASMRHRPTTSARSDRLASTVRVIGLRGNHRPGHGESVVLGHDRCDDSGAVVPAIPMPRLQQRLRAPAPPEMR